MNYLDTSPLRNLPMQRVALAFSLLSAGIAQAAHTNLIIMPVGDSITEGVKGEHSYREEFESLLSNNGCDFQMAGSASENHPHPSTTGYTSPHEGYTGHKANVIRDGGTSNGHTNPGIASMMSVENPAVVFLHAGSNDINSSQSVSTTVGEIEDIVHSIDTANPNALIFVANVIPWYIDNDGDGINDDAWVDINDLTDAIDLSYSSGVLGSFSNVVLVDVRDSFVHTDMISDGIHPNSSGEAKIAQAFIDAFVSVDACQPPATSITYPAAGASISSPSITFTGTATDDGITGISHVRIALQDNNFTANSNRWFNFNTQQFASYSETTATMSNTTTNNTDWSITTTLPEGGDYKLLALAVDHSGNEDYDGSGLWDIQRQFQTAGNDVTDPIAEATSPSNGNSIAPDVHDITGTAVDTDSGVSLVRVRVQQLGTSPAQYWNGSNWTSNSTYLDANLNNAGTSWTLSAVNLTTNGNYRIRLHAFDNAGNFSNAIENPKTDFSVVTIDNTIPSAQATSPSHGSTVDPGIIDISGISSDDSSGVDIVLVLVRQLGTSPALYWNGNSWAANSTYLNANVNSAGTSWTLPDIDLTTTGDYRIRLQAYDNAGNFANTSDIPRTDFSVGSADNTIPSAQVTSPSNGSTIDSGTISISGTASDDNSGVDIVRVRIQRLGASPRQIWNGSDWTPTSTYVDATLNNAGTSWTLSGVDLNTAGTYRVRLHAYDIAGNFAKASDNPTTNFTVN